MTIFEDLTKKKLLSRFFPYNNYVYNQKFWQLLLNSAEADEVKDKYFLLLQLLAVSDIQFF